MDRRVGPVLGSILFLAAAPGTVAGLVPRLLTGWRFGPPFLGWPGTRVAGLLIGALGLEILLESFARFALQGLGTPAPVAPTERLVVSGWYRRVRNPMYVGVLSLVLGQALLFGSPALLWYSVALALGFHLFVIGYEEPTLQAQFGAQYAAYRAQVGRWWPRLRPWQPE